MSKGYSSIALVSQYLGATSGGASTLTIDQKAQCTTLLAAAEALIDRETRRAWLAPAITAERYDLAGPQIFLRQRPVASVQNVHVRSAQVGDPGRDLTANSEYELLDANLGQLRFANISGDQVDTPGPDDIGAAMLGRDEAVFTDAIAFVSYTPVGPAVPADIQLAATMIVAHTLYLTLNPDRTGISQLRIDQESQIQYASLGAMLALPQTAQDIVSGYRLPIFA